MSTASAASTSDARARMPSGSRDDGSSAGGVDASRDPRGGARADASGKDASGKNGTDAVVVDGGGGGGGDDDETASRERGFFDGFDPWKLVAAGAVGCAVGLGYSVFDQTILHKPKQSALPYTSRLLQAHMPDVVERAEKFNEHRRLVAGRHAKREFDRLLHEMLKQSEYFAAIYSRIVGVHAKNGGVTPGGLEAHFRLKAQAKAHWDVIVQLLRAMSVLIGAQDNLMVENDFNRLWEAFYNRFYMIHQHVLGAQ